MDNNEFIESNSFVYRSERYFIDEEIFYKRFLTDGNYGLKRIAKINKFEYIGNDIIYVWLYTVDDDDYKRYAGFVLISIDDMPNDIIFKKSK